MGSFFLEALGPSALMRAAARECIASEAWLDLLERSDSHTPRIASWLLLTQAGLETRQRALDWMRSNQAARIGWDAQVLASLLWDKSLYQRDLRSAALLLAAMDSAQLSSNNTMWLVESLVERLAAVDQAVEAVRGDRMFQRVSEEANEGKGIIAYVLRSLTGEALGADSEGWRAWMGEHLRDLPAGCATAHD